MKTKLTLFLIETSGYVSQNVIPRISFICDKDDKFISRYVASGTIEETIDSLIIDSCNLHPKVVDAQLVDLIHERGSSEVEAIFVSVVQFGILAPRKGYSLKPINEIEVKDKYVRAIQRIPRC